MEAAVEAAEVARGHPLLFAHKVLLQQVPFFSCSTSGRFAAATPPPDVAAAAHAAFGESRWGAGKACSSAVHAPPASPCSFVDMTGFLDDGLSWASVERVVRHIYGGEGDGFIDALVQEDPAAVTEVVVAAERLGVGGLVKLCERALVGILELPSSSSAAAASSSVEGGGAAAAETAPGDGRGAQAIANAAQLQDFARQFNLRKLECHCSEILQAAAAAEAVV